MYSKLWPSCQFFLRKTYQQAAVPLAATAIAMLLLLVVSLMYLGQLDAAANASAAGKTLVAKSVAARASNAPPAAGHPEFEDFDSTRLVSALSHLAAQEQLTLAEVGYTLDENANLPYLRYRATLNVVSNYRSIRNFVDHIGSGLRDVSLDNISCTRESIKSDKLSCDLAFSAFYRKAAHG